MRLGGRIALLAITGLIAFPLLAVIGRAPAENGPQATIAALQTRVAVLASQVPTATPTPQPTAAVTSSPVTARELAPGLELLSYRFVYSGLYRADSSEKVTFVLGEIRNITDQELDAPGLRFVLLDKEGNIVGDIDGDPLLPVIQPHQTMPFASAIFGDEPRLGTWATERVELCSTWGSTDLVAQFDPQGLALRDVTEETHTSDELTLSGKVVNGRSDPAQNVYIYAAIYDKQGRFAGSLWKALDVAIPAGKTETFHLDSQGYPTDPIGVAGTGYRYQLWVGFGTAIGAC